MKERKYDGHHKPAIKDALDKLHDENRASGSNDLLVVYSVLYCSCIFESAFATVSLHRTKKGAVKAMIALKKEELYQGYYRPEYIAFGYGKKTILD